jgi:hypothetical protein
VSVIIIVGDIARSLGDLIDRLTFKDRGYSLANWLVGWLETSYIRFVVKALLPQYIIAT